MRSGIGVGVNQRGSYKLFPMDCMCALGPAAGDSEGQGCSRVNTII